MTTACKVSVCWLALSGVLAYSAPAVGHVSVGTGNAGLIGGDLTDPTDTVALSQDATQGLPEEQMLPKNAGWIKMTCAPVSGPYAIPHQRHPYQSWVGAPAAAIFLNKPEQMKWYVDFKDGGYGGPSREDPYFAAVQFKDAYVLTHFTVTLGGDAPERDPKEWAIQGSNTGEEGDWTDVYVCNAKDRSGTALQEGLRNTTILFTSFDSAGLARAVAAADAKKLQARLGGKTIAKADFARPAKAYTWFRIAVYSCFNPSAVNWIYRNASGGFALGQLELFGAPGAKEKAAPKAAKVEAPAKAPAYDAPFIISYWCGPPMDQTTLERYKEIAECGFTMAFPAIDVLGKPFDKAQEEHNRKYLDVCQQAGLKGLVYDALDTLIATYSSHPAMMGFFVDDEPSAYMIPRLALINQYLLEKDPTHLPYINLLPSYASGNPHSYDRFVDKYVSTVKPVWLSWDHYMQMFEGGDERYYWDNLEMVRKNCLKAKIPYNQIIVCLRHMGYRECSEADIRWQVWTSLAYGSRGIQYFVYWYEKSLAWAGAPALIDKYGHRDVKWGYAQKINRRIAQLGPTLVKLVSTGVYCTDPLPIGTIPLLPEAPVTKADGGAMAIGCFRESAKEDGIEYILPVNRSLSNAITASLTLEAKYASASEISQETGKPLPPVSVLGKTLDVPLEAGEGRLFLLNRKK
ncbi:MAG: hypothetical protein NT031_14640 [Planctomycetota bacterium]|nr:hypothetical protein [Planctomycetota bacterium]